MAAEARAADPGPALPATPLACEKAAETQAIRAAPRRPDALPDKIERPFATQKRDDEASDAAALRPVAMPWEAQRSPRVGP
jgi:hypothetical protein